MNNLEIPLDELLLNIKETEADRSVHTGLQEKRADRATGAVHWESAASLVLEVVRPDPRFPPEPTAARAPASWPSCTSTKPRRLAWPMRRRLGW